MSKTKKWSIWIVIIAAVVGGIVWFVRSKAPKTTYTTADVTHGSLKQTVSVTGDLIDNSELTMNFEIGGRITKEFVKVGDKVTKGQPVATIDDGVLSAQARQAKDNLDRVIADSAANDDALREAKVAKDNADNTLGDTKNLDNQNIEAAKKAVDGAEQFLTVAQNIYNGNPTDANKITLTTAQNGLTAAQQQLKVVQQQADLAQTNAQNVVDSTKAKVKTVESDFAQRSRDAAVDAARANYDVALQNLGKATLLAPANGQITEVNDKVGEVLGAGVIKETFMRMISFDYLIESKVPESDIVKVQLGQKASVTFDALTLNDVYDAEVAEINPESTVVQDVVYYQIKLRLGNIDVRLKPGMSANIDIHTSEKDNVLMIPMRAVKTDSNKQKTVDVLQSDNTVKTVKIETGLQGDEGMIEVKSGLNEGDKVITFQSVK